ncbi:type IV toxin-antitoxin system AbiEi family antitoxin domain-containing protein [Candidatus Mycolicibacterium alkanivorans]|uniref:Cullin, a subunit of E3 ubiquitin ligase n=1 Tax=Candidatus Mycolicibacterium alkanivorans TaxID=2954114 RepID=A0ABS9Z3D7_9MYCO|nr:type IV toxin-antitoxin system AbiEi family antitoxin domain-containing protein [Candidatus Mycolicibacterium alkanivorans]MCI4677019.1 hypothetical protein [Candidatus Mycolicibacterium alkanivorans]
MFIDDVFAANGGLATTAQLLAVMSRKSIAGHVRAGAMVRVWHGVYALEQPSVIGRLAGLELMTGRPAVACMSTAAKLYGFDTENDDRIHVLDPGIRLRPTAGLRVHQRTGAPLRRIAGRLATAPAWTAVETARALRRPRAVATLDAALRCGACTKVELEAAAREQKGRRGIVNVRNLLPHADGRSESAMESEARLVFIDGGLPPTEIQYQIVDHYGDLWRADFAWPEAMVAAEYDSMEWHANPTAWKRDHIKTSRLQECGWELVRFVVDDVRRQPVELVHRVASRINAARLVS